MKTADRLHWKRIMYMSCKAPQDFPWYVLKGDPRLAVVCLVRRPKTFLGMSWRATQDLPWYHCVRTQQQPFFNEFLIMTNMMFVPLTCRKSNLLMKSLFICQVEFNLLLTCYSLRYVLSKDIITSRSRRKQADVTWYMSAWGYHVWQGWRRAIPVDGMNH